MPMPVVAAQRLAALLEVLRLTDAFPDIGPDGKVQVTMEYAGDIPVRITKVVVSVQHSPETGLEDLRDMLRKKLFPLAFKGMNTVVTGWKPFSNPRMFAGYGRQKGWECDNFDNKLSDNEGGFVELSEEECRQLELPKEWIA